MWTSFQSVKPNLLFKFSASSILTCILEWNSCSCKRVPCDMQGSRSYRAGNVTQGKLNSLCADPTSAGQQLFIKSKYQEGDLKFWWFFSNRMCQFCLSQIVSAFLWILSLAQLFNRKIRSHTALLALSIYFSFFNVLSSFNLFFYSHLYSNCILLLLNCVLD